MFYKQVRVYAMISIGSVMILIKTYCSEKKVFFIQDFCILINVVQVALCTAVSKTTTLFGIYTYNTY